MKPRHAEFTITSALRTIEETYYQETEASGLVKAGFGHLQTIHSSIRFTEDDDVTLISIGENHLHEFDSGSDTGEARYWGQEVTKALVKIDKTYPAANIDELTDTFMQGLMESLHERSSYVPINRKREEWTKHKNGKGGIDIKLEAHDSGWKVKRVLNLTLRDSGDLRRGDIIVAIDGNPIDQYSLTEVNNRLRGPVGSKVTLSLLRQGGTQPTSLSLQRDTKGSSTVAGYDEARALRIEVARFDESTSEDLEAILTKEISVNGRSYNGLILDMRHTEGGLLNAVLEVAELFLDQTPIIETQGRHPDSHQYFSAGKDDLTNGMPLVVLVNEDTASGAEIVTAALQESDRALVIGQSTYGAGTIQKALLLSAHAQLLLPWAEVYTAAGYRLEKRGVLPTICTGNDVTAEALLTDLRNGGSIINFATRTQDIDPGDKQAVEALRAHCPPRSDGNDIDLEVAKALLEDPILFSKIFSRSRKQEAAAR